MTRRLLMLTPALLLFAVILPVAAQAPIDDGAPAEAVLYVGWAGTPAVEADYEGSTLKKVVDLMEPAQVARAWTRWRGFDRGEGRSGGLQ